VGFSSLYEMTVLTQYLMFQRLYYQSVVGENFLGHTVLLFDKMGRNILTVARSLGLIIPF